MIHTFSVTVETNDSLPKVSDAFAIAKGIEWDVMNDVSVVSVQVKVITGLHRQHLIGETEDV